MSIFTQFKEAKAIRKLDILETISYVLLGISVIILLSIWNKNIQEGWMQQDIAKQIIRFHIIANSDTEQDQQLKLKIKDQVVLELQNDLANATTIDQARMILTLNLNSIENIAKEVMEQEGYHYSVKAYLAKVEFPAKVYGDLTFPPGIYEALRIDLGDAKGKNWWCVMFPSLCFVDETYSVVPDESKDRLKYVLTAEEYNMLEGDSNTVEEDGIKIIFKSKLAEWWNRQYKKK